ncbi:MAG: hypothetical protein DBX59_03605 [Bacillota bacterium]|nr:MAG: hypothetical protein DBX59_03605 [Bacillota bacterium]
MKKLIAAILAVALLAIPFAGCKEGDDKLKTIELNEVTHSVFYAPMYVAIEKGYFEEEGLSINLTNGGGADKVMTAVLSNSAQIGLMGPESSLYVYNQGKTDYPIVFGQLTQKDGSFLVSRVDEPNFKWEDLRGKGILAGRPGGVPMMTFEYLVNQHGLYDDTDCELITDVQFNLMTAAFEEGTGDYCTMFEPLASEYEKAGKGYVVASVGEGAGEVPYTSFVAKQSYINENTETINSFLKAIKKAYDYMKTASDADVADAIRDQFPSTSIDSLKASVASYKAIDAWTDDLTMSEESYNRLQDIMQNAGELDARVPFDKIVNNSYAEALFK